MPSKKRDFIYDNNDLIVAGVILLIAFLVIFWRVQIIMAYPKTLVEASTKTKSAAQVSKEAKLAAEEKQAKVQVYKNGKLTETLTLKVVEGSQADKIQKLVDEGLYENSADFKNTLKKASISDAKVQADTYILKKGWTKTTIAKTVTKSQS